MDNFYSSKDVEILYIKDFNDAVFGISQLNAVQWVPTIKHSEGLLTLDRRNVKFYSIFDKKGTSRWIVAMFGTFLGPIASVLSSWNGLGKTSIVYLELINDEYIIIKVHDDYFKYIKKNCQKVTLDDSVKRAIIHKVHSSGNSHPLTQL